MTCATPIPFNTLVDWWTGDLVPDEIDRFEEHLFGCAWCERRLDRTVSIVRAIPEVVRRRGGFRIALTDTMSASLDAHGVHLRHYRAAPGDRIACTVGAEDDLVVTWLSADLAAAGRADIEILEDGAQIHLLEDVPILRARTAGTGDRVSYALPGDLVRTFPDRSLTVRLHAFVDGTVRIAGEYHFDHASFRG